ncbi:hypothetical protein ACFYY1_29990 [Streptomyces sp. NPDC001890]|uniref:hypothetical protein n=1 Tax=Streptomyces sp. NPDC001890 TaxID=3364620 RepID=UPI0036C3ACC2
MASLLMDLVERARDQHPAPPCGPDGIRRVAAQLLLIMRAARGFGGRLLRIETWPARRTGTATRVGREALIDTRQ